VAYGVFDLRGELGHGAAVFRDIKERVIPEPPLAAGLGRHIAPAAALNCHTPPPGVSGRKDTDKGGLPSIPRHIRKLTKEFHVIDDKVALSATLKRLGVSEPFALYTGVWRNHKNLPNLLKAFRVLCDRPDFNGQLVITGRDSGATGEEYTKYLLSWFDNPDLKSRWESEVYNLK